MKKRCQIIQHLKNVSLRKGKGKGENSEERRFHMHLYDGVYDLFNYTKIFIFSKTIILKVRSPPPTHTQR